MAAVAEVEVRKNESEKLILRQDIIQCENRINLALFRAPQTVERSSAGFLELPIPPITAGAPSQLLENRPDIREAEREVAAAGLDVLVARARFFPRVTITGNIGYEAFNPRYLFSPDAVFYNALGNLAGPVINKKAIQADYMGANARQLEALYNYQQTVLNAFTQVDNRMQAVDNYSRSLAIKNQQIEALKASVDVATRLFNNARAEYVEVLLAQRDLRDARNTLIETKKEQLAAIVRAYQALGGGAYLGDTIPEPPELTIHGPYEFRWPWHLSSNEGE